MRHSLTVPRFQAYIGIDYSGAQTPTSRLAALQVYMASPEREAIQVKPPPGTDHNRINWTRREIALWLVGLLADTTAIVGIDHGLGFPLAYLQRYRLGDWDAFLDDFAAHWPTDEPNTYVDFVRAGNPRSGSASDGLRLTERWTSSAKSVFQFDCQGSVAKSTHAGLPWLRFLRRHPALSGKLHVWPFDGFEIPPGKSVLAEVYPSMFRNRYDRGRRTVDQHDAYATARWLKETDARDALRRYMEPPLAPSERRVACLEGWILGVT
jgi:hypothetical protein